MSAMITATQADAGTQTSASKTSTSQFNALNEQSFMKLLTTQLQHQDPTNPVDEKQLASEMAQFSSATGINTLNNNVSQLVATQKAGALAKAAGLIGKRVATPGDALITNNSGAGDGAFKLADAASHVSVDVFDGAGKKVGSIDLGTQGPGTHTFTWQDGASNQVYQFKVRALGAGGQAVPAATSSLYTVNGVHSTATGLALSLKNNPTPLAINDVNQVL